MLNHLMIDLETLGVNQDSVFVSVGLCTFDPETGEIEHREEFNVDWQSSIDSGRSVTAGTLKWWLAQDQGATVNILLDGFKLERALIVLSDFIKEHKIKYVWGNGATFDISILENSYTQLGMKIPWDFWNVRDVRTIKHLAPFNYKVPAFEGTQHKAMDDAVHQAMYVSEIWQLIKKDK